MDDETLRAIEAAGVKLERAYMQTVIKMDELYAIASEMLRHQQTFISAWSQAALRAMNQHPKD